jgi:CBS domain-containing protein
MKAMDIMTNHPVCCEDDDTLQAVAALMAAHDCGEIPVLKTNGGRKLIGVITDRDIVCRIVAKGLNPREATAADCMTAPAITISPDSDLDECCSLMERHQVRRLPVVDATDNCIGIVSIADLAAYGFTNEALAVFRDVSRKSDHAHAS